MIVQTWGEKTSWSFLQSNFKSFNFALLSSITDAPESTETMVCPLLEVDLTADAYDPQNIQK